MTKQQIPIYQECIHRRVPRARNSTILRQCMNFKQDCYKDLLKEENTANKRGKNRKHERIPRICSRGNEGKISFWKTDTRTPTELYTQRDTSMILELRKILRVRYNSMRPSTRYEVSYGKTSVFPWCDSKYTLTKKNVQILNLYTPHSKEITPIPLPYILWQWKRKRNCQIQRKQNES